MDHLKTDQERRDRWYVKDVEPRFVEVHTISLDLMKKHQESESESEDLIDDNCSDLRVPGIPASLLCHPEAKDFLKSQLHRNGFVVVKYALDISQCNHALSLAWDYLEGASAAEEFIQTKCNRNEDGNGSNNDEDAHPEKARVLVSRDDPASYSSPYYPRTVEGGICPFYGSGHTTFQWYLRSQSAVQDVFAVIHDVKRKDLVTSLDGVILWTEPSCKWNADNNGGDRGWFHIDQNPQMKPGFESVQGLVNLLPVTKNTGGNVLQVGSHKLFPRHYLEQQHLSTSTSNTNVHANASSTTSTQVPKLFYKDRLKEIDGDDWLEIDPNDTLLLQKDKTIVCLLGPGDVLVWDSRLVHCSHPPTPTISMPRNNNRKVNAENENIELQGHGLLRAAGLVNMIPREKCSTDAREARIQAIRDARTLTHWVNKGSPLGEERGEDVAKEKQCVRFLKSKQDGHHGKQYRAEVLLSYDDLSMEQKRLI